MQSFKKKIVSLISNGIDPLMEGIHNFKVENKTVESLAKERVKECGLCDMNIEEPISFLQVEDKRIPELSNRFCDDCGCTLSYKLRQSQTKCIKWQES